MSTLILAGRFDRVALPRFSIQFKQYAPQAEFVMFEKSGHNPYVEEPAKMFEVVRRFLSR
jgi:proline iminopeptidase